MGRVAKKRAGSVLRTCIYMISALETANTLGKAWYLGEGFSPCSCILPIFGGSFVVSTSCLCCWSPRGILMVCWWSPRRLLVVVVVVQGGRGRGQTISSCAVSHDRSVSAYRQKRAWWKVHKTAKRYLMKICTYSRNIHQQSTEALAVVGWFSLLGCFVMIC